MSAGWLTGRQFRDIFRAARSTEVKVEIFGNLVPVVSARYDPLADAYVIRLDEECEDYMIATAPDGDDDG